MYYTGIGSRETPQHILDIMRKAAFFFASKGIVLRSGKAAGADEWFQLGVQDYAVHYTSNHLAEIYIPWRGFKTEGLLPRWDRLITDTLITTEAEQIASKIHPAWHACSRGAKALHIRNVYQVLGATLDKPSDFLVCYAKPTKDRCSVQGGTATAYNLARQHGVRTFNIFFEEELEALRKFTKEIV